MRQRVAALLFLLLASLRPAVAAAQERIVYPKGFARWTLHTPPKNDSAESRKANYSDYEWVVSRSHNRVIIKKQVSNEPQQPTLPFDVEHLKGNNTPYFLGLRYIAKVNDGWLVGFNAGEWGGTLWWFSPNGKKRYMISKDQVCGYIRTKVGLLALEGLAHGFPRGKIIRLRQVKGRWTSERFVDLRDAPYAVAQDADGSLVVATTERLLRVHLNKKVSVLLKGDLWSGTYLDSMVRAPSGNFYMGMRYAVAKISRVKNTYKVQWLIPDKLRN